MTAVTSAKAKTASIKGFKRTEESRFKNVENSASSIRSIDHNFRQQIICWLEKEGKKTVEQIWQHFRVEQSVASQHLAILRQSGIVKGLRDGKHIRYEVDSVRLKSVLKSADQLSPVA